MNGKIPIVILGAGGFAKEIYHHIVTNESCIYHPVGFYSDSPKDSYVYGLKVIDSLDGFKHMSFVCAVGDPFTREKMVNHALEKRLTPCAPIFSQGSRILSGQIGLGSFICADVFLSYDVTVGEHCIFNVKASVGHGTTIGDFCTVGSGALIAGDCRFGRNTYVGIGAVFREKVEVGERSFIGMGSVITKSVPENTKVFPPKNQASLQNLDSDTTI